MTYSIVARDAETGELGVGIQSRAFRSGGVVPWALPGVGAVATQAFSEKSYGALGLELMRAGKTPEQALAGLVAADPLARHRQVSMLEPAEPRLSTPGMRIRRRAPDRRRRDRAGQLRRGPAGLGVDGRRVHGVERLASAAPLRRARGGRGGGRRLARPTGRRNPRRSAQGQPWETVCDLRVDDHEDPLGELGRLLDLHEGYTALGEVDESASIASYRPGGARRPIRGAVRRGSRG